MAKPIAPMPMTMEVRRSQRQVSLVVMTITGHSVQRTGSRVTENLPRIIPAQSSINAPAPKHRYTSCGAAKAPID